MNRRLREEYPEIQNMCDVINNMSPNRNENIKSVNASYNMAIKISNSLEVNEKIYAFLSEALFIYFSSIISIASEMPYIRSSGIYIHSASKYIPKAFNAFIGLIVMNHQFNWWFDFAPIRGLCLQRLKGGCLKHVYRLASKRGYLLVSSLFDSSFCC